MGDTGAVLKRRLGAEVFFGFFAVFTLGSLGILTLGVVSAWAHHSSKLHASLHQAGLSTSLWGRHALAMADASHRTESWPALVIDYGFSTLNLALAGFLLWLRPSDRTARLLAIGMVGTAAVFNLQAHGVYEALNATSVETYLHYGLHLIAAIAYTFALLSFPEGTLVPRWPRWAQAALYTPLIAIVAVLAFGRSPSSSTSAC